MTNEELIESLALLKEQARNSGANTFVWDINIDSFNFVMDSAIKAFAQEPKTGHWNDIPKYKDIAWQCSECGHFTTMKHNYCPNCGAKMESENDAEYKEPTTKNDLAHNLCDSCTNIGCEFQSGIVRTKCAFYMPSITPQEPTIKALGKELRKARKGIADEKVLIGYNLAVAICNKHLGESEE